MSAVDVKDGLLYTDWRHPGDAESVLPSKMLWALGNYSRFVRPGYVRVGLAGDPAAEQAALDSVADATTRPATRPAAQGLMGSAYVDPRSGRMVVVYVNDGPARRVTLTVAGGHLPTVVTYTTSATQDLSPHAQAGTAPVDVPARSIVTVVADPR